MRKGTKPINDKSIQLSKDSFINERLIQELEILFQMSSPSILKKSITDILLAYLSNTEPEHYKLEINEIAKDFQCLLKFLEIAEMMQRAKTT